MATAVSVGICAHNEGERLPGLLDSLMAQSLPEDLALREVLVVASGCTDGTEGVVAAWSARDPRVHLIREPERRGKTSALNLILGTHRGEVLVLVNADARLAPMALARVLEPFRNGDPAQLACGLPVPRDGRPGLPASLQGLLWNIHNRTLQALAPLGLGNHCCDELMAVRRGFVQDLPRDVINDGAYLGVLASLHSDGVAVCPGASVVIDTPRHLRGFVEQRHRILRGHRQVMKLLDHRPSTLEGLARRHPGLALRILLGALREHPRWIFVLLFVALPLEFWANLLTLLDEVRGVGYEPAWRMVD